MEFRTRKKFPESPLKRDRESKKFLIGTKVLCYEPDKSKQKILYDAKIMDVCETKDKRGRKKLEYLIHFQGWSSSWDRRVPADFVLKDSEENRNLQKHLAEKSQLQLGTYLYRKERKKRRKLSEKIRLLQMKENPDGTSPENVREMPNEEDSEDKTDPETMDYSSSVESSHDDDRIFLTLGDFMYKNLELDAKLITKEKVLVKLPAYLNVLTILENFVKYYTIKQITGPQEVSSKPKRRSSLVKQKDSKVFDISTIETNIELCKEVADGLRIYFNFILKDYLLYAEERNQSSEFLSEEYLKNFVFSRNEVKFDVLPANQEYSAVDLDVAESVASSKSDTGRRLRSHKPIIIEENEIALDIRQENLSSMTSSSSNDDSELVSQRKPKLLFKTAIPMCIGIPTGRKLLQETLSWKLLPVDSPSEPSMIYGIVHLTRLVVKLPEFLSATPMGEEKLMLLLKFLNHFAEFLEDHEHLFGEQNYDRKNDVKLEEPAEKKKKSERNDRQGNKENRSGPEESEIESIIEIKTEQVLETSPVIENSPELIDERFR